MVMCDAKYGSPCVHATFDRLATTSYTYEFEQNGSVSHEPSQVTETTMKQYS